MSKQGSWIYLAAAMILIFLGCSLKTVETGEIGYKTEQAMKVLIAYQETEFKRAVVSEVRNSLYKHSYYVKIVDVKYLNHEHALEYNAIVLINKCMAGRPDPRVEGFIDKATRKNKIILLTTGMRGSWKPESRAVDAMTSASQLSESTAIAQSIIGKIMEITHSQ